MFSIAGNFSADIEGTDDNRPNTWGKAGVQTNVLTFQNVPAGRYVKLVRLAGDFIVWPTRRGGGPAVVEPGRYLGALAAIQANPREKTSTRANWAASDTFVYVQTGTNGPVARAAFDVCLRNVSNAVLGPTHELAFVQSAWLNDTGLVAHCELTFSSIQFHYVRR